MKVISILGTTPQVLTEFVDYLYRIYILKNVDEIICIGTSDQEVKENFELIRISLMNKFKFRRIKYVELPFNDPIKKEDFYLTVKYILQNTTGINNYYNISGGRKNMVVAAYLSAMLTNSKVFHIINKEVKNYNADFERIKDKIKEVISDSNKYLEYKDEIEKVLYPDPSTYEVIELPVIPISSFYISLIKRILSFNGSKIEDIYDKINISKEDIEKLIDDLGKSGIIQKLNGNRIHITPDGENIINNIIDLL